MSEGAYALVGVIIGGAMSGVVAWVLDRLRLRDQARVAALVVSEELMYSMVPLLRLRDVQKWGVLSDLGGNDQWTEHRAVLARVLPAAGWQTVSSAYAGIGSASTRQRDHAATDVIEDRDGERIAETYLTVTHALAYLTPFIYAPPRWRVRARRTFAKEQAADIEQRHRDSPATQRVKEWQERRA